MQDTPSPPISTLGPKDQLPVVISFLDDARRIIEAGKGRRWEVFKWAFALNVLVLSVLAVARDKLFLSPYVLQFAAMLTSFMAWLLIDHYDNRVTKTRDRANNLYAWLQTNIMHIHPVMGEFSPIPPEKKDRTERVFFFFGIFGSLLAIALAIGAREYSCAQR